MEILKDVQEAWQSDFVDLGMEPGSPGIVGVFVECLAMMVVLGGLAEAVMEEVVEQFHFQLTADGLEDPK